MMLQYYSILLYVINCALQCIAVCCSVSQGVAVRCSLLQCVAVRGSAWQCVAVRCSHLHHRCKWNVLISCSLALMWCSLRRVVMSLRDLLHELLCSGFGCDGRGEEGVLESCALQCVAVCCSVLQCVAV